jgi:hypothetical protein
MFPAVPVEVAALLCPVVGATGAAGAGGVYGG